jgi:hypothetical protein
LILPGIAMPFLKQITPKSPKGDFRPEQEPCNDRSRAPFRGLGVNKQQQIFPTKN